MSITLYAAPFSSALPVSCALRELELPHERVNVKLGSDELKRPEFLKLNPNGKVPTLVVDGTPMFESLAICQWLGDRFGVARKLWPAADAPERMTALSWTAWVYVTYGAALNRLNYAGSPNVAVELHNPKLAEHTRNELQQLLGLLDAWLAPRGHILGEAYSLADLIVSNVVRYGTLIGAPVDAHPQVRAWLDRCHARPAMRSEWG